MATPIAAASGRQAWRQLMRNTSAVTRKNTFLSQQQSPTAVFRRAASSPPSPSSFLQRQQPAARRSYSSGAPPPPPPPPPRGNKNQVKFWPFVIIIACGSGGYILLANQRKEMPPTKTPVSGQPTPAFSPEEVTVLFVLGGPGAGKGTQCARLVKEFNFHHLSAGDLLRAEQERPGSQYGELIKDCIKNGAIVPMEVTVALLQNAMSAAISSAPSTISSLSVAANSSGSAKPKARFLIDGFPRKMDQAVKFEEVVCPAKLVLFYDCPEEVMEGRLLERGKTSGRADDNAESIRKRFRTFIETSMPVVDQYEKEGKVVKVNATRSPEEVYADTRAKLIRKLGDNF
ncbi:P-loop containing nucleoside triphosphate hydrolase protein [Podospora australis]|uniref:Uridylate kinase n=1 Tax=Podospora australis TaxID=1536484 RepID=A0AAN7ALP5_9PEZI|nr:P-loop containing nucleoside triphosphate hydrolase protein [Podospora australis]